MLKSAKRTKKQVGEQSFSKENGHTQGSEAFPYLQVFLLVQVPQLALVGFALSGFDRQTRVEYTDTQCPLGECRVSSYSNIRGYGCRLQVLLSARTSNGGRWCQRGSDNRYQCLVSTIKGVCTLPCYCCQSIWNGGLVSMWVDVLIKGSGVSETQMLTPQSGVVFHWSLGLVSWNIGYHGSPGSC